MVLNRIRTLLARAANWTRVPAGSRQQTEDDAGARLSRADADEVVMLAHDIRNLLVVITRAAAAMRERADRGVPVTGGFREFDAACERTQRIVHRLMSIDRLSRHAWRPVDVNQVVIECSRMIQRMLGDRIRVKLDLGVNQEHVMAERLELERILLNLAMSARQAMPDGGVLTIQTASLKQVPPELQAPHVRARSYVRLTVSDTGAGMLSGARLRVLSETPLRKQHGAELGLAAVAHTVRALEGAMQIEADDGQGTRVVVDLPCIEPLGRAEFIEATT